MTALQSLALLSALPFSIVMIGMMISLWRSLSREVKVIERLELRIRQREFLERYSDTLTAQVEETVATQLEGEVGQQFQAQLSQQVSEQVQEHLDADKRD